MARISRWLLLGIGGVWTSPNTLLGLGLGAIGLLLGASVRWRGRECALTFGRMPGFGGSALTLGNVILHGGDSLEVSCLTYAHRAGSGRAPPVRLADHERAHVYQYMVLGPLFLPVYLACGGVSVRNRFERAADRYAASGRDWWPRVDAGTAMSQTGDLHGITPMTDELDLQDLEHLARVAEGRGAALPAPAVARLMQAGLVRRPERVCEGAPALELTPAGLARVRSSDQ